MNRKGQRIILKAFLKHFKRDFHVLQDNPQIIWQQMYNRLQWEDEAGLVSEVTEPQFKDRTSYIQSKTLVSFRNAMCCGDAGVTPYILELFEFNS